MADSAQATREGTRPSSSADPALTDPASVKQHVISMVQGYRDEPLQGAAKKAKAAEGGDANDNKIPSIPRSQTRINPGVFLQVAPFVQEFLDVKELVLCRSVNKELGMLLFPKLEQYVLDYFRPTTEMVLAADIILENGKWARCTLLLAELAHLVNERCRQVNLVGAPLVYRVFLARELIRFLDKTEEPILWVRGNGGRVYEEVSEWNYVQQEFPAWDVGSEYEEDDCPPLVACFKNNYGAFTVLPDNTYRYLEYDESPETQRILDNHGLTLCHVPDYDDFVLLSAGNEDQENDSDEPSRCCIAAFGFYGGLYTPNNEIHSRHNDLNVVQLFMSLMDEDNNAYDFDENAYTHMDVRGMVVWYTLLQSLELPPFADGVPAQALWDIVSGEEDEDAGWNSIFQYYHGLELYKPNKL